MEIYRGSLKRHIVPHLGGVPLGKLDSAMIREWRARILGNGTSVSEAAKAYRFLRAVLMTAVDDLIIPRNPCRIRGAGAERPEERPVLTVRQVLDLAERMPDARFRMMVLLAAFASLRWGELSALRRCDLDPVAGTVSVRRQHVELDTGQLIVDAAQVGGWCPDGRATACHLEHGPRVPGGWRRSAARCAAVYRHPRRDASPQQLPARCRLVGCGRRDRRPGPAFP